MPQPWLRRVQPWIQALDRWLHRVQPRLGRFGPGLERSPPRLAAACPGMAGSSFGWIASIRGWEHGRRDRPHPATAGGLHDSAMMVASMAGSAQSQDSPLIPGISGEAAVLFRIFRALAEIHRATLFSKCS